MESERQPTSNAQAPSVAMANFVEQYYKTSTFHHLSTWKYSVLEVAQHRTEEDASQRADIEVNEAATQDEEDISTISSVGPTPERAILHIDLDCFYASVAKRDHPELVDRPVAVCPSRNINGTSEISSCCYLARKFGVKARMFVRDARKLCPTLAVVLCEFERYERVSKQIFEIFLKYTRLVVPVSADEAFLDITAYGLHMADTIATKIRQEVFDATGVPSSAGIAPNMLLAKMATQRAKPEGQYRIAAADVSAFLAGEGVEALPGVGPTTAERLASLWGGVRTVPQLQAVDMADLQAVFGDKLGHRLWQSARGIDNCPVAPAGAIARRSVCTQISWGVRFNAAPEVAKFLRELAAEVARRLQAVGVRGRRVALRIKKRRAAGDATGRVEPRKTLNPGAVDIVSKSVVLQAGFTDSPEVIANAAVSLFEAIDIPPTDVRGAGLQVDQLDTEEEESAASPTKSIQEFFKCSTESASNKENISNSTSEPSPKKRKSSEGPITASPSPTKKLKQGSLLSWCSVSDKH